MQVTRAARLGLVVAWLLVTSSAGWSNERPLVQQIGDPAGAGAEAVAAATTLVPLSPGIDPRTTMEATQGLQQPAQQEGVRGEVSDKDGQFVDVIETSNREVWSPIFRNEGVDYRPPEAIVAYSRLKGSTAAPRVAPPGIGASVSQARAATS